MFKQAILAAATAGLIATGGLATTTAANAAGSVQFGGPGWSVQLGNDNYGPHHQYQPQRFCTPIVKKVKWWDRFGYPHWSQVVVGQKCPPIFYPPHNHGPFPPHGGQGGWDNDGQGGWNGGQGGNGGWNGNGGQGW